MISGHGYGRKFDMRSLPDFILFDFMVPKTLHC